MKASHANILVTEGTPAHNALIRKTASEELPKIFAIIRDKALAKERYVSITLTEAASNRAVIELLVQELKDMDYEVYYHYGEKRLKITWCLQAKSESNWFFSFFNFFKWFWNPNP
jgi:hypothetical protein